MRHPSVAAVGFVGFVTVAAIGLARVAAAQSAPPPLISAPPPPPLIIENPHNTALGQGALWSNISGQENVAIGAVALYSNTTGNQNTATGEIALPNNTTGDGNVANGYAALNANTTGGYNTASGFQALFSATAGSNNTAVGVNAGYSVTTGQYNVFLGADVVGTAADANTMRLGLPFDSGTGVGQNQTFIAGVRGTAVTGGEFVYIDAAGKLGSGAISIGANSVGSAEVIDESLTASDLAPDAVGASELGADAVTAAKVAFNYAASTVEGGPATDVACVGCVSASEVGFSFASLGPNTFTGSQSISTGNLDLGASAATTGNFTKNGVPFLHNFGTANTFLGVNAGNLTMTGTNNTAIGYQALTSNTTGGGNTALGYAAGSNATTGSNNIFLGHGVVGTAADSNTMRIGLPYAGGAGQNRTFIAGIHGTSLTGSYLQVVVDANGQLGTLTPPVQLSGGATATPLSVLQQQVQGQQATIAAQQATIEDLVARLARLEAGSGRPRRR
jgi:hypothetical protein